MILLIFLLAGCGSASSDLSCIEIASYITEEQRGDLEVYSALPGSDSYDRILTVDYGIDLVDIEDGAILAAGGTEAFEIAALKLSKDANKNEVQDRLIEYISRRTAAFTGYFPEQEKILMDSRVFVKDGYALLLICPDPDKAEDLFKGMAKMEMPETIPDYPSMDERGGSQDGESDTSGWVYDHDLILLAWWSEGGAVLKEQDRAIIDACKKVFEECKKEGQTVPQFELAVHDWLIDHMEYDPGELDEYDDIEPDPYHDSPYGALIRGKGICEGYTKTFQLLMDMAGIECISIYGNSDNGVELGEHAWNQVKLDGEWYVVDVTWDDPVYSGTGSLPQSIHHKYFNVTWDDIKRNHFFDETGVPKADGTKYTWKNIR